MIFWRAGTSEKGTDRDGEADQRGRRDLQDQEAEQERRGDHHRRRRPRRDGGGEAADIDARSRASAAVERTFGTRGTAGQEVGYRQVSGHDCRTLLKKLAYKCNGVESVRKIISL